MNRFWPALKNVFLNIGFWILSLLCEVPYFFCMGLLVMVVETKAFVGGESDRSLDIVFLISFFSLFCRFISLHVLGSWILKRFLLSRGAGPFLFGLADFILANLWVVVWALLQPHGMAMELFRDGHNGLFLPNGLWVISIPPIALGSLTFRLVYGKYFENKNIHTRKSTRRLLGESS